MYILVLFSNTTEIKGVSVTQDGFQGWGQTRRRPDDDAGAGRSAEGADRQTGACPPRCR